MTSSRNSSEGNPRTPWISLGWAAIALVVHTLFTVAVVPSLPSSVLIWIAGSFNTSGDHYYPIATSDLVMNGYWAVGIIAVAAVVGLIADMRRAEWSIFIPLVVCAATPCLMFFVYGSAAWQIGRDTPATTMSSSTGFLIMLLGAAGVVVGLFSLFSGARRTSRVGKRA